MFGRQTWPHGRSLVAGRGPSFPPHISGGEITQTVNPLVSNPSPFRPVAQEQPQSAPLPRESRKRPKMLRIAGTETLSSARAVGRRRALLQFGFCWVRPAEPTIDAGWSSLVARRAHNPKVAGSNPAPATESPGQRPADRGFYRQAVFFSRVSTVSSTVSTRAFVAPVTFGFFVVGALGGGTASICMPGRPRSK